MDNQTDMSVEEFYSGFNLDFLSEEERQTIYTATELFAKGKVRQAPSVDAEQAAKEAYPEKFEICNGCQGMYGTSDVNYYYRQAYIKGWQQGKEATPVKDICKYCNGSGQDTTVTGYTDVCDFCNGTGYLQTPTPVKEDGLISKADVFEQAIRDFGIEAALEYFNVKESDKQFFRNELSKPASTDSKEAIEERKFIQFIDWKEQNFNYDGKNDKGEGLYVDRQSGKFSTTAQLYKLFSPNEANKKNIDLEK